MKILTTLLLTLALTVSVQADLLFSNNSITGFPAQDENKIGVYIVSTDASPITSLTSLDAGLSLSATGTYGSSYEFINTNTVTNFFGLNLSSGGTVTYGNGIDQGDSFGVLLFDNSTTTTVVGDTFSIYTDATWVLPADPNGSLAFGTAFNSIDAATVAGTGTVVPEPSTYALFAGIFSLGYIAVRRSRKSDETEVE